MPFSHAKQIFTFEILISPCTNRETAPKYFQSFVSTSIHSTERAVIYISLDFNNNFVSNLNLNIPTTLTYNNSKLHLNQCPGTFQTFRPTGTRVPEKSSSYTTLSQQIPTKSSNPMSRPQLQNNSLTYYQISFCCIA